MPSVCRRGSLSCTPDGPVFESQQSWTLNQPAPLHAHRVLSPPVAGRPRGRHQQLHLLILRVGPLQPLPEHVFLLVLGPLLTALDRTGKR